MLSYTDRPRDLDEPTETRASSGYLSPQTTRTLLWNSRGTGPELRKILAEIESDRSRMAFRVGTVKAPYCNIPSAGEDENPERLHRNCTPGWSVRLSADVPPDTDESAGLVDPVLSNLSLTPPSPLLFRAIARVRGFQYSGLAVLFRKRPWGRQRDKTRA